MSQGRSVSYSQSYTTVSLDDRGEGSPEVLSLAVWIYIGSGAVANGLTGPVMACDQTMEMTRRSKKAVCGQKSNGRCGWSSARNLSEKELSKQGGQMPLVLPLASLVLVR